MNGYPYASGPGGAQPLPPAFTQHGGPQPASRDGAEQRPQPPFFAATGAAPAPVQSAAPEPPRPQGQPGGRPTLGGLPADAIYMPDAEIPKRPPEPEHDYSEPARRPMSTTDAAVMIAARLELLARGLRERGTAALQAGFAGDPLDAALSGVISGYLAGRGR